MNKKQLEEIWRLTKEIEELLDKDPNGTYPLRRSLEDFRKVLETELKNLVWKEYLKSLEL